MEMEPGARVQVERVVAALDATLGPAISGSWLHGSAVRGGLRPRSDLDVLVVLDRPTTRAERDALIRALLVLSGRAGGGRPLELTAVIRGALQPWVYPPPLELQYGEWWRRELEAGAEPWASRSSDLVILLAEALETGEPLGGSPAIADVLPPVPPADVQRAALDVLPALGSSLEGDEANVLLTFARILVTLETGRIVAKDEAADQALGRVGPVGRPALLRARGVYLGTEADAWKDRSEVQACARDLLVAIAEAADRV